MEPEHFYFISDDFFNKFPQEEFLMRNKQERHARPCFFVFADPEHSDLLWCVPISSQVSKYNTIIKNKFAHLQHRGTHYPKCSTIRFAKVLGYSSAFLIQNMFPVTKQYVREEYLDTKTQQPVTISQASANDICINAKNVLQLVSKGHQNLVYVDILKMRQTLLAELEQHRELVHPQEAMQPSSLQDRIQNAQLEADQHNHSQCPDITIHPRHQGQER